MRKFLLLLIALLTGVSGAWAETYTITYGTATGTFYRNGAASTDWSSKWVSNEAGKPVVTITTSVNNMNGDNARIAPQTYTITAEAGYVVTGFAMNCPTFGATVTLTPDGESAVEVAQNGTLVVNSSASKFVFAGGSNQARIQAGANDGGSFTITVEDDPEAQSWIPSFGIGSTIVVTGEKTESVTAATNGADNDHWYLITQVRNGESALYDNGTQLMRGTADKTAASFNGATVESNSAYLVRFISAGSDDLYHIQLGNGKYIVNLDANPGNGAALNTTTDYRSKGTHAFYNSNGGSGSYFGWNLNSKTAKKVDNNGAGNTLSYWGEGTASGTSGNSIWYVYPVEISVPSYLIQYSISFGGNNVFTSEPIAANYGDVITELPSAYQRSFCDYNVTETTVTTPGVTTVPVTMTWNGPFTISSNFASASWYLLRMQNGSKNMKYQDGSAAYPLENVASYDIDAEDYYSWAFTGDPYNGFTILNKQAGETKKLYKGASVGNGGIPTMSAENESTWNITRGDADSNFGISPVGHNFYLNAWSGGSTVQYWQTGPVGDSGSRFTVLPVEDIDFTSMVTSYIKPYIDNPSNAYFAVTSANVSTLVADHEDGGSKTSWTKSEYQAYYNALQNAITKPVAGYYVLKNVNSNNYLTYNGTATADGANNTATAIIKLGVSGSGYTLQMQGGYLKVPSYQESLTTQANPSVFYATIANNTPGQVKVGTDDGAHSYINYSGGVVKGLEPTTNTGWWILEDAPASITIPLNYDGSADSYGTMYLPFGVTLTGAKAYILTVDGEWAKATEIADVPANTGVLIRATGEATSVTATINDAATAEISGNDLVGTFVDITTNRVDDSGEYILGQVDGYVGFYQRADGKKIGANKAYLNLGADLSSGGVKGILWDYVDGVKTIDNGQLTIDNDKVIYNLAGQRINKLQRGVNIVNGKKVLVK